MSDRTILALGLVLAGWLALVAPAQAEPQFPALTGRVVDDAAVIDPDVEDRLTVKLRNLEEQSGRQLVVATVSDLQGYDIADYGYQLGRHWGIGSKEKNDGVLLIVAPRERKLRIEVGYGLEAVLTDGLASKIINETIVPYFKNDMIGAGIEAGADDIMAQLALPEAEAQKRAAEANEVYEGPGTFWPLMFVLGFLFVFIWVFMRVVGATGGRWT